MSGSLESILRRDRWVVAGGLALMVALAWSYLLVGIGMESSALEMTRMSSGGAPAQGGGPWEEW
jgi:predicted metal-binding membrane protein